MSHRLPFPSRSGWPADEEGVARETTVTADNSAGLWKTLENELHLTAGGRILFVVVVVVVGAIGVVGLISVVANLIFGGIHGDQVAAVAGIWAGLAVAALFALGLGAVLAIDGAFRGIRVGLRRLTRRL